MIVSTVLNGTTIVEAVNLIYVADRRLIRIWHRGVKQSFSAVTTSGFDRLIGLGIGGGGRLIGRLKERIKAVESQETKDTKHHG